MEAKDTKPWPDKYTPQKLSEIIGQDAAIKAVVDFITNYKKQKKKAILLHGPTGTGKTATISAIAKEKGLELLEVNASDFRNKEKIEQIIGKASKQQSLFFREKIILFDEIDGVSGDADRGGISALAEIIDQTSFPIIMTANDAWDQRLKNVRKESILVEFLPLNPQDMVKILEHICKQEKVKFTEENLKTLARRSGGDVRGAINDLQTITQGTKELTKVGMDTLGERKKTEKIEDALLKILKTTDPAVAMQAIDSTGEDSDEFVLWLDENLPREYTKPEELARAYDALSRADVFKGRIRRQQHWRFMVYITALLSAGVSIAKKEKYKETIEYKPTSRILKLWMAKQKNFKRKAIAEKIAKATHTSGKRAFQEMSLIQNTFKKDKDFREAMIKELELEDEEIEWLKK